MLFNVQRLQGQLYGVDRFMNITGNHDIGYSGELSSERLERWETHFGSSNYVHNLSIPSLPPLRIVLFNSLSLDSPATDTEIQQATYSFLQSLAPDSNIQTILLTHLPLYRGTGVCTDPPRFEYWALNISDHTGNITGSFHPIKRQNHLSRWASDWVLETIFPDENGLVLDGHDHTGCDVLHKRLPESERDPDWEKTLVWHHDELRKRYDMDDYREEDIVETVESATEEMFEYEYSDTEEEDDLHFMEISQYAAHERNNLSAGAWQAEKFFPGGHGVREITVRSMMGDFEGNVGLLTATYNHEAECTHSSFLMLI